ncbi:MAG TPA: leucine--tRNA ligase [Acidimicrobiia bacterium]|nr:leucine--tRNA ligase [Acidimicrobiia bacterium]
MTDRPADAHDDVPAHRYNAALATAIETKWQDYWAEHHTFYTPNPTGLLSDENAPRARLAKRYVLDMFPYPSGSGLHVGHPLGFIGTDVYARFSRMSGFNVLHTMGFDAFGLPAEQYAVETGTHPRETTEKNIDTYRRQLRRLGMAHDPRRSVATTDVAYYRWTQWIFLQIFNSWYDTDADRARPVNELVAELDTGTRRPDDGSTWSELDDGARRDYVDAHRLAYIAEAPVNWCPALGTVLANEEVTADGRSERGNFPVFKRPLKQWMLRITAYSERLLDDLDLLDWTDSIKLMQRNWIGRSVGAEIRFPVVKHDGIDIRVFTTRPDTLFGATYMVLAPEHPLVDAIVAPSFTRCPAGWRGIFGADVTPPEAVAKYREFAARKSELERQADAKEKTGVFTGAYALNPVTDEKIPIFIADYVLMGYGTGAIMAVPGQDERDWEFAEQFGLPIVRTVQPPDDFDGKAYVGDGPAINSGPLDGLHVVDAKRKMIEGLERGGWGRGTITYKLRDWLFSRQRYWGEPFPVAYVADGESDGGPSIPRALPDSDLPVLLPDVDEYAPKTFAPDDRDSAPESPLARATEWTSFSEDLASDPERGWAEYVRETNTMPQWAGSCWYHLRYLDPTNTQRFVDPDVERFWLGPRPEVFGPADPGGVDLYVGGVEHAVLHLLYARFWQKVLFDLGHVSASEPFRRLFNQGYIQAWAYIDARGVYVPAEEVVESADSPDGTTRFMWNGQPVTREYGKMGKSLRNVVTPDEMCATYGADTFRLYEMSTGPMEASRPWSTRDVVGSQRFLQRVWRLMVDENDGSLRVAEAGDPSDDTLRLLHRTIDGVRADFPAMHYNTAAAKLIELANHLTKTYPEGGLPRSVADPLVLMLSPLCPHLAEELWSMLGHPQSLAYAPFPVADEALLVEETAEYPIQVNGKVRSRITVPASASDDEVRAAALADPKVVELLEGAEPRKVIVVPGRLVNIVK